MHSATHLETQCHTLDVHVHPCMHCIHTSHQLCHPSRIPHRTQNTHLVEHRAVVFPISILVEMELYEILQRKRLARDRMLVLLLYVGYNVDDIKACTILGTHLYLEGGLHVYN